MQAHAEHLRGTWASALVEPRRRGGRLPDEESGDAREASRPSYGMGNQAPELALYQSVVRETVKHALTDGPLDFDRMDALLWLVDPRPRSDFRLCCQLAGIDDPGQFRAALLERITDPLVLSFVRNAKRYYATLLLVSFTEALGGNQ